MCLPPGSGTQRLESRKVKKVDLDETGTASSNESWLGERRNGSREQGDYLRLDVGSRKRLGGWDGEGVKRN